MTEGASITPSLPRRDRMAILVSLGAVTALSWVYVVLMARGMHDMPMAAMIQVHAWTLLDFLLMFLMWAVMMVGMMLPTAVPMTLIYAAVARKAERQGTPVGSTGTFVAGYLVMWMLFSIVATVAQWGLDRAALLSPMMVSTSPALGAGLLIVAGLYQLTPFKNACLEHCRGPANFFTQHWRKGLGGAFRMGLVHGVYCLGCCWVLMGLLFVGGVMNLLWIAAITFFVLVEKVLPFGDRGGQLAGALMIIVGGTILVGLASGDTVRAGRELWGVG